VPTPDELKSLFLSRTYLYTLNKSILLATFDCLKGVFPHGWICKVEEDAADKPKLFLEARLYGANLVVGTYDATKFSGVALEIIFRQYTISRKDEETPGRHPCRSNVYLFTPGYDYVAYLDGATINRHELSYTSWPLQLRAMYASLSTAKEILALRKKGPPKKKASSGEKKPEAEKKKLPKDPGMKLTYKDPPENSYSGTLVFDNQAITSNTVTLTGTSIDTLTGTSSNTSWNDDGSD
jgi:hypothetical protein